jgi:tetratricopeptide (TPR) repeat protein
LIQKKLLLFRIITLLVPFILIAMIEGGLRLIDYPGANPLFINVKIKGIEPEYQMINPRIAERYFPRQGVVPKPVHEYILREKPENGYRIFVLGGSTAASWPYPYNALFSRILRQRLADTFPDREIEVINTGIAAINSYTLLDFMDEILALQPDAILIYAGHNEYYGALGAASSISFGKVRWVVNLYLSLLNFKITLLLREVIMSIQESLNKGPVKAVTTHTILMDQVIGDTNILYGSPAYERGKPQFENNLRDILRKAGKAGVPVLISELVSNIRDHEPFVSKVAADLPPADTVYQQARQLEAKGNITAAREAYYRAKDLDTLRFRAPEDFNHVIHQVADEYAVPVVPMRAYFEAASPNGIIGNNLMVDHLHPNIEGNFILSKAFLDTMMQSGLIEEEWPQDTIKSESYYRQNWNITSLTHALGKIKIINLKDHWPFKPELKPSGAVKKYEPQTRAESLAKKVFFREMTLKSAHREMATYYKSQGEPALAAKEYAAITAYDPIVLNAYHAAADSYMQAKQFDKAELYLSRSLRLSDTGYANKWLGLIKIVTRNELTEGIPYLEKAQGYLPDDAELLHDLSKAYMLTGNIAKARETVTALEQINPDYKNLDKLKTQLGIDHD